MPIFNTRRKVLREAIESILSQTFTDFEFLILNDSPENYRLDRVIASYSDHRITYLRNEEHLGLERSTNRLLALARGEYVAIFDHDDVSLPQRLLREVEYLDAHPRVGVVSAQFEVFGRENWTSDNPVESEDIKAALEHESRISHTAAMFRKQVLTDFHINYEPAFFPAASYRILTRVALVAEVYNLPEVLLRYRMDGNNTSLKFAAQRVDARERVRAAYVLQRREMQELREVFGFGSIVSLSGMAYDNRYIRHYQATKDGKDFFVKASSRNLRREYEMACLLFGADSDHFVEPVAVHDGGSSYFVMKWVDGVNLEVYLGDGCGLATVEERMPFLRDLRRIADVLIAANVVHRDIIPRNFLVDDGRLYLTDLYFAVDYCDYREYDYVAQDLDIIVALGESYALGVYRWDDAYSLAKVAEYVCGSATEGSADFAKIAGRIGERVIAVEMADVVDYFQHRLDTQNAELVALRTQVARLQPLVDSRTYKIGRVAALPYRVTKRLRYWARHH